MISKIFQKWISKVSKLGSALPAIWFAGFLFFYFRAWHYLGRPPQPNINDPKLLPFNDHHRALVLLSFPLVATVMIVPLIWIIQKRLLRMSIRKEITTFVIGWALICSSLLIPSGRVVEWFLD